MGATKTEEFTVKQNKYFTSFKDNLLVGVGYYKNLVAEMKQFTKNQLEVFENNLHQ